MKRLLTILFLLELIAVPCSNVQAHVGGGPPFVLVNNNYAQTSPLFLGATTQNGLNIPQDVASENYLVNQEVTFTVDTTQLTIDPNVIQNLTFTWSYSKGPNLTDPTDEDATGTSVKKSFSHPGSYLVTLKSNPGGEFIILDTILVNILPRRSYHLPTATIEVRSAMKSGSVTHFSAASATPNSSFYWDFTENKIETGRSIRKTFKQDYFYTPVVLRMYTDNFISDTGVLVIGDKGKISYSLLDPSVPKSSLTVQNQKELPQLFIPLLILTLLVLSGIIVFVKRKKKYYVL